MYLIDDVDAVFSNLGLDPYLFDKLSNIVHSIIRRCIQFMDIEGMGSVKTFTRRTPVAGLNGLI